MSIETWDQNEITKLAFASGKPLEIQCAEEFIKAGWNARLGSFFKDIFSEKTRELDVYIKKEQLVDTPNFPCVVSIRILGSCKGFAVDHGPVTYSVSHSRNLTLQPTFMFAGRSRRSGPISPDMGTQAASNFLQRAGLKSTQIIGFDIFERKMKDGKEYHRKGDRDLFEGLDSAIKAGVFWRAEDTKKYQKGSGHNDSYATLTIPLLVTSLPFWNVTIDKGKPNMAEISDSGYFVGVYPFGDGEERPEPVMSIVWAVSQLGVLIHCFDSLFQEFQKNIAAVFGKH